MIHLQLRRVGTTNLQLDERLMNLPTMLRKVLCPTWKNDLHD